MDIKHLPCDKQIKTVCPMTLAKSDGPYACCEKQCAWWQTFYEGKKNEYSECAIKLLTRLQDNVFTKKEGIVILKEQEATEKLKNVLEKLTKATDRGKRIGMYGETPRSFVGGGLTMCLMDPDGENKSVWISNLHEGGEFQISNLTWPIPEFFSENM